MTERDVDDEQVSFDLSRLWERHRQTNLGRVATVEETAAAVVRGSADDDARAEGISAAHELAGSLGTFGFEAGSRIALEIEALLKDAASDPRALADAVGELRASIDETAAGETVTNTTATSTSTPNATSAPATLDVDIDVVLVSNDPDLAARMTTAAASSGLTCEVVAQSALDAGARAPHDRASLLMVDQAALSPASLAGILERTTSTIPVAVLTSSDTFPDRIELARAGVVAAIPRAEVAGVAMEFVSSVLATVETGSWSVRVLGSESELGDALQAATSSLDCELSFHERGDDLWDALESQGADLVVLDSERWGAMLPAICRVIRADPSHRWTPILAFGRTDDERMRAAIEAGLDVLQPAAGAGADHARLQVLLRRAKADRAAAQLDRLTRLENRNTVERSLDRVLRLSNRNGEPFALAKITVDRLEEIGREQGAIAGDLALQFLARAVKEAVRPADAVGRWSTDALVIGFGGTDRVAAQERLQSILERVQGHELVVPAGEPVEFDVRGHVAAKPEDGTSLASLERTCQNGLDRSGEAIGTTGARSSAATGGRVVDVVLVEDDDSIADVVEYALDLRGYRSERFVDGREAARALTSGDMFGRVILLDVGLPSLDGFGVLRQLGAEGVLRESHLIMLTARSSEGERLRALDLGATEHIAKPFSVPVLIGRLDQVLGRTGAQR